LYGSTGRTTDRRNKKIQLLLVVVAPATSQRTSTAFFAGKKLSFFDPRQGARELSSRKSTSNFVESDGIARSLLLVGIKEIL
jgi:hypothetical protein